MLVALQVNYFYYMSFEEEQKGWPMTRHDNGLSHRTNADFQKKVKAKARHEEYAKKMRKVPQSTKDADAAYQSDKKNGYLGHFPHAKNNPVLKSWSRNQK